MIAPIKSRIPVAGRGSIYHLKITLAEVKPPIWRRLRVPGEANLGWLHVVIQVAIGWTNSHLHQFTSGGTVYSDPGFDLDEFEDDPKIFDERQATLQKIAPKLKSVLVYEYDFGDSWIISSPSKRFCLPIRRWRRVRNAWMAHAPVRRRIAEVCAATRTCSKSCATRAIRNISRCSTGWAAPSTLKSSIGTRPISI